MASVNKHIIVGNLGGDPEIRTLESGVKCATFSVATSETWKDKEGNKQEETQWHNVVLWRGIAEVAQRYLKKGSSVYIEGKSTQRTWEKDGQKFYKTELVGNNLVMLGGKSSGGFGGDDGPKEPGNLSQPNNTSKAMNDQNGKDPLGIHKDVDKENPNQPNF